MTERVDIQQPHWLFSWKADPAGAALADRHYSRRQIGHPQFMPPGQTVVLISRDSLALFGWWRPHPGANVRALNGRDGWTCSIFRNESPTLSSTLILEAEVMLTLLELGCGPDGFMSYVEPRRIRSSNPGCCFKKAEARSFSVNLPEVRWRLMEKINLIDPLSKVQAMHLFGWLAVEKNLALEKNRVRSSAEQRDADAGGRGNAMVGRVRPTGIGGPV